MDTAVDLRGKRALVTGASSGIGAGLAEALAQAGATVGLCARRADRLAAVLERCRQHAPESRMWVVDLADFAQVDDLARRAASELGGIDVLVNNAGMPKRRRVLALDHETVVEVANLNYLSPVRLTLALLPHMVEQQFGLVVNVSSVAATLSSPGEAAYDASKAALTAFSEAMAVDLWDTGVRVLVVYPGVVDTELFTIPGNDPLPPGVTPITIDELVAGVMDAIGTGAREVYIPGWFKQLVTTKVGDLEGFMSGAAAYLREHAPS